MLSPDLLGIPAESKGVERQGISPFEGHPPIRQDEERRDPPRCVIPDITRAVAECDQRLYGLGEFVSGIAERSSATGLSPIRDSLSTKGPMPCGMVSIMMAARSSA